MPGSVAASTLVRGAVVHRPGPITIDAVANATIKATRVKTLLLPPISNLPFVRSHQPTDPAARGVAIPQDAIADVQPVRLRILPGDLDARDPRPVRGIELVNDPSVGFNAPQESPIPREPVRPHARRRNRSDDRAALRLHQEEFPGRRHGHPVLV